MYPLDKSLTSIEIIRTPEQELWLRKAEPVDDSSNKITAFSFCQFFAYILALTYPTRLQKNLVMKISLCKSDPTCMYLIGTKSICWKVQKNNLTFVYNNKVKFIFTVSLKWYSLWFSLWKWTSKKAFRKQFLTNK